MGYMTAVCGAPLFRGDELDNSPAVQLHMSIASIKENRSQRMVIYGSGG